MKLAKTFLFILFFQAVLFSSYGQRKRAFDLEKLYKDNMIYCNCKLQTFSDGAKTGLFSEDKEHSGIAWLKDVKFSNGTIEVDLQGKDLLQQSFLGIAFHGINDSTYDAVYFRPFNFQADDSVRKIHAVQYISMPQYPWDLLRNEHNGIYEKSINPPPSADQWIHVKIQVEESKINVYVNNTSISQLSVAKLNKRKDGNIGLWFLGNAKFSNLTITPK
ncbi:MAG TPA: family 16 glycoside hydrolase [Cytophagaceae bacterium]|jgi:hypothetical protein